VIPLIVAAAADSHYLIGCTVAASLICLLFLGGVSAKVGGADVMTGALRVTLWSALAMGVTAGVGALVGTVV
jgi:vacuolar iron transporter family protein